MAVETRAVLRGMKKREHISDLVNGCGVREEELK